MATFVWTGATSTNPATGSNWKVAGVTQASPPTAADDVLFGSGTGATNNACTIPASTTMVGRSFDFTGYTGTLTFSATTSVITIGDATAGAGNVALKIASGMTITLTAQGTINFISTNATQQTITTAGKTMPILVFNGAGGSWINNDTCSTSSLTLTAGTWNTGNQTINISITLTLSGSTARTLTMGSSTINLTRGTGSILSVGAATNLTITANTANITLTSSVTSSPDLGTNINWNGMSLNMTSAAQSTPTLSTSGSTINNFTWAGPATKTSTLSVSGNLTCTGAFTWSSNANSAINRSLLSSGTIGTPVTITAATANISNVDLKDITFSVSGSFTTSSIGDCGGNSGVTVTTPVTRYAVVAGNVSSTAMWSTTSNGAGGSSVPLPQDTVFFTSNSAAGTYTNDMPRWGTDVDFTGFTRTFSQGLTQETYGSLTLSAGMTYSGSAGWQFGARTSETITSAGQTIGTSGVAFQGPGGTWTLQDALSTTGATTHTDGTLNTNGFSYTTTTFTSSGTRTRVLTLGASTINISSTAATTVWNMTATGLTINAGTSNIVISTASANTRVMTLSTFVYNTVTYTVAGSSGQLTLGAATYLAKLDMDISATGTARTLQFNTGSSYTIANFNVMGSSGNVVSIKTTTGGTAVTLALLGPVSTNDWLDVRDITSIMPYKFYAGANSTQASGGNTNVIFTAAPTQPCVWTAQNTGGSGTSVTSTFPAGLSATAGNLLLVFWGTSVTAVSGMTPPSGYTLIDNTSTANSTYVWYKIAAGGETAATVTTTSSHSSVGLSIMEIGSFTGTPTLDVYAHTDSVAALTSQTSASVTNTAQPAIAVAGFSGGGNTGAFVSITNSWQEQRYTQLTFLHYFALPLTSTGAQSTTYTWTTSRSSSNATVVFKGVASSAQQRTLLGVGL